MILSLKERMTKLKLHIPKPSFGHDRASRRKDMKEMYREWRHLWRSKKRNKKRNKKGDKKA